MPVVRRKFLVGFLVILILVLPLCPAFEAVGTPMEEGALLVYPELILKGAVPYRDFETFYGPANPWLLSGIYALTGPRILAERTVGLLYRVAILAALFVLLARCSVSLAAGCSIAAGLLFIPLGLGAFAWIGGLMCVLWSVCFSVKQGSPKQTFLGGLFAGLALLFRPDLALAALAAGLPLFLLMHSSARKNYLAGVALGLLPYGLLAFVAGPRNMLDNLVLFPVFYSSPARHIPILSAEPYVIRLFFMHLAAVAINLLAGGLAVTRFRTEVSARLLLSLALLGLGLTHQAAQRLDFGHLISAALLSIPILPLSICILYAQWRESSIRTGHAVTATAVVVLALLLFAPRLAMEAQRKFLGSLNSEGGDAFFVEHEGRSFPTPSAQLARAISRLLNQLTAVAKPGDRLFVGPSDLRRTNYNDTFMYHLLPQLRPATYFLEMNPLSANRPNSRLAADVASANWLVLTHHWDAWNEPNESRQFGSDAPMEVVRNNFDLCGRYENYDLYRRRLLVALRN